MSPGAKVFLTLAGVGIAIGSIVVFSSKKAKAATLPPQQPGEEPAPPDVVVPPHDETAPSSAPPLVPSGTVPPFVPAFPQFTPTPTPAAVPAPAPLPAPLPLPVSPAPAPAPAAVLTTPLGTLNVPLPVAVPDVLATQPAGAQPPPPPVVPLPPIVSTPPGPVPVPPIATAPTPSSPVPVPVPAPTPVATAPVSTVSAETAAMVQALLLAEQKKGWNTISAQVTAWQKSRGLVQDGKFGMKSALTVAAELGTIPIIRFWPKGSIKATVLNEYRAALFELASKADPARAEQLRFAAEREKAQSFGVKSGTAPPIAPELQVSLAKVA